METDSLKYIILNGFENYEISTDDRPIIREIMTGKEIRKNKTTEGYINITLNGKRYLEHRIIAIQFIDNPRNLPCVDHINHIRDDNRVSNLRWATYSDNSNNKIGKSPDKHYDYISYKDIDFNDLIKVDRYGRHQFKLDYYYNVKVNRFYMDNGVKLRELHTNKNCRGACFVRMKDNRDKDVNVFYSKFKREHDIEINSDKNSSDEE